MPMNRCGMDGDRPIRDRSAFSWEKGAMRSVRPGKCVFLRFGTAIERLRAGIILPGVVSLSSGSQELFGDCVVASIEKKGVPPRLETTGTHRMHVSILRLARQGIASGMPLWSGIPISSGRGDYRVCRRGSRTVNVVPSFSDDFTSMVPLWAVTIRSAI